MLWMLLQNPLVLPKDINELLPGQSHPGLGCLNHIMELIFMLCERLRLEAVAFNPSHYHVCFIAKGEGYFIDPKAQARFQLSRRLTAGMPLYEASRRLRDADLPSIADASCLQWQPSVMVIMLRERVREALITTEYQEEVNAEANRLENILFNPQNRNVSGEFYSPFSHLTLTSHANNSTPQTNNPKHQNDK